VGVADAIVGILKRTTVFRSPSQQLRGAQIQVKVRLAAGDIITSHHRVEAAHDAGAPRRRPCQ
jgi:hypothetical protein